MTPVRRPVWWLMVCLAAAGCRGYDGDRRYPLSGRVTYGGVPLDAGTISFIPKDGGGGRVAGGPIVDGAYAIPEDRGANAGAYRVEIRWQKLTGKKYRQPDTGDMLDERKEGLPPKYHAKSELTAEVAAGKTTFDFNLPKGD